MSQQRRNKSPLLRRLGYACSLLAIVMASPLAHAEGPTTSANAEVASAKVTSALGDLGPEAQAKVKAGLRSFLSRKDASPDRDAGDLGWDCMAAAELAQRGDPRGQEKLKEVVQALSEQAIRANDQVIGWPYRGKSVDSCKDGGLDAFGDGTCNKKDTVYSFQTGLAIACMAKAGNLLHAPEYTTEARQALDYWQKFTLPKTACGDCTYYLYSDDPNDRGRYVRNVNVFMAFGAATLGENAHDATATKRAQQAMRSEVEETHFGNQGYLGHLDPEWIKKKADATQNIENHAAAVALMSDLIGSDSHSQEAREHGMTVWHEWATCNNKRCAAPTTSCSTWGGDAARCQATLTATHCAFRNRDPLAKSQCGEYLRRVNSLSSYGLWALLAGTSGADSR